MKKRKDLPLATQYKTLIPTGNLLNNLEGIPSNFVPPTPTSQSPASQIPLTSVPASKFEWVQSMQSSVTKRDPVSSLTKTTLEDNDDDSLVELSDLFDQVYTKSSEDSEVSMHRPARLSSTFLEARTQSSDVPPEGIFNNMATVEQVAHNQPMPTQLIEEPARNPIHAMKDYMGGMFSQVKKLVPFKERLIKQHANMPPIDVLAKCTVEAPPPHIDSELLIQFKEMYKEEPSNSYQDPEEILYKNTHTFQDIKSSWAFQEAKAKNIRILHESMSHPSTQPVQVKELPHVWIPCSLKPQAGHATQ